MLRAAWPSSPSAQGSHEAGRRQRSEPRNPPGQAATLANRAVPRSKGFLVPTTELPPVTSVLPHRAPFLMVSRIFELRDGYVAGLRTFRPDEPFFAGHFPGHPVVPGVLLIEGLAQTMAYYALVQESAPEVFLVGVDRARFRVRVEPGAEVIFEVKTGEQRFGLLTGHGRVSVSGRTVAEATLRGFVRVPGGLGVSP